MTTEHKLPSGTLLIVPLKENKNLLRCEIPEGFELLGESTSLTEGQLSGIMPKASSELYYAYNSEYNIANLRTSLESFASLKQYLKLDESKRWIVLFKTS